MKFDYPPIFRKKAKNNTLNYKITQNITKPTFFRWKKEKQLNQKFSASFCVTAILHPTNCFSTNYTQFNRLRIENSIITRSIGGIFCHNKPKFFATNWGRARQSSFHVKHFWLCSKPRGSRKKFVCKQQQSFRLTTLNC